MSKKWFVIAVAAMLVSMFAGSAFAAEKKSSGVTPNLDKGTKVLEGAGYINLMADEVQFQLAYGQLVADGIEVAVVAGLRDNDYYMSTELGVRAEYNLVLDSALVPFLSAGVVWAAVEADDSGIDTDAAVFSVGGGVKYFIRDDVALAVNGSYLFATDDIFVDSEDGKANDDDVRILFSVRFFFD
jgi:opacity protein-like surface antigen